MESSLKPLTPKARKSRKIVNLAGFGPLDNFTAYNPLLIEDPDTQIKEVLEEKIDPSNNSKSLLEEYYVETVHWDNLPKLLLKLWQLYPTPECYQVFDTLIRRWSPSVYNTEKAMRKPLQITGKAGGGKTSIVKAVAELLRGSKDPETGLEPLVVWNAGGRNLDHLLEEPIFTDGGKSIVKQIETLCNTNQLSKASQELLLQAIRKLPEASQEKIITPVGLDLLSSGAIYPELLPVLQQIATIEGISDKGNEIGITYKEGALITAAREGQILLVDEIDKRSGGGENMHDVLLTLANIRKGAKTKYKGNHIEFEFNKDTVHPDFDIIATANDTRDIEGGGFTTSSKKSFMNRWEHIFIDDISMQGMTHRAGQFLSGMNLRPLELLSLKTENENELLNIVKHIYTSATGEGLPENTEFCISQLKKTLQATKQIAAFFYSWRAQVEGPLKETDEKLSSNTGVSEITINARYLEELLDKSLRLIVLKPNSPQEASSKKIKYRGENSLTPYLESMLNAYEKNGLSSIELNLGRKIIEVIHKAIDSFPLEEHNKKIIRNLAYYYGIKPEGFSLEEPSLIENTVGRNLSCKIQPLESLLNDLEERIDIKPETIKLQEALIELIKETYPEIENANSESILSVAQLQRTINQLQELSNPNTQFTIAINPDYMGGTSSEVIKIIPIYSFPDAADKEGLIERWPVKKLKKDWEKTLLKNIPKTKEFLSIIAHPDILKTIIDNFWEKRITSKEIEASPSEGSHKNYETLLLSSMEGDNQDIRITNIATTKNTKEGLELESNIIISLPYKNETFVFNNSLTQEKADSLSNSFTTFSNNPPIPITLSKLKGSKAIQNFSFKTIDHPLAKIIDSIEDKDPDLLYMSIATTSSSPDKDEETKIEKKIDEIEQLYCEILSKSQTELDASLKKDLFKLRSLEIAQIRMDAALKTVSKNKRLKTPYLKSLSQETLEPVTV